MATKRGKVWPFYVVMAKEDKRIFRHPTRIQAEADAVRLVQQTGKAMNVFRWVARYEPVPVAVREREVDVDQDDTGT